MIFEIYSLNLTPYAMMIATGALVSVAVSFMLCKVHKKSFDDSIYMLAFGYIGAAMGAKILYLLVSWKEISALYHQEGFQLEWVIGYIRGGFVFYGGLMGAALGVFLSARYFSLKVYDYIPALLPPMVLFAGFGRIGCFLTGCCYGCETSSFLGYCYHDSMFAPNGVPLVPVQLIEAVFDFLLVCLFVVKGRRMKGETQFFVYVFSYALFRFFLEFWRGDEVRGHVGLLSVSQFISLVLIACIASIKVNKMIKYRSIGGIVSGRFDNGQSDGCSHEY